MAANLKAQIIEAVEHLTPEQQQQVLDFAKRLQKPLPPGIPGEELWARAQALNFELEDLEQMNQAIEEWCEKVDPRDW